MIHGVKSELCGSLGMQVMAESLKLGARFWANSEHVKGLGR